MAPPRVLILGHSFIRRLKDFIASHPDLNANFFIAEACEIKWHGVGGRTIAKARAFDLPMVESFLPQIVILQLESNDLVHADPLSIASAIEDLVTLLARGHYRLFRSLRGAVLRCLHSLHNESIYAIAISHH